MYILSYELGERSPLQQIQSPHQNQRKPNESWRRGTKNDDLESVSPSKYRIWAGCLYNISGVYITQFKQATPRLVGGYHNMAGWQINEFDGTRMSQEVGING